MTTPLLIEKSSVHLWPISLKEHLGEVDALSHLLTPDEMERALRFKYAIHRQYFIIARAYLRRILSLYTAISPEEIQFSYGEYGKPFLKKNDLNLHFNLSHSQDWSVYAVTREHEIGVDIEKIGEDYNEKIVKRFFSKEEQICLDPLTGEERIKMFYQIWARKEAIIKTLGKNLYSLLSHFSVPFASQSENILLTIDDKKSFWHVEDFFVDTEYQAAFAIQQSVEEVVFKTWQNKSEPRA